MPTVTNHRGPSFREYRRTPTENKMIELEQKVAELTKLVENLTSAQAPAKSSRKKKEENDA